MSPRRPSACGAFCAEADLASAVQLRRSAKAASRASDLTKWTEGTGGEARRVIRVSVPIDVGTIAATENSAFALATPLRVERLLVLAVTQACGARAPQEKRERHIRTTLEGFRAGKFLLDVDGRIFDHPDAVAVCSGVATLRFFSAGHARRERETAL